MPGDLLEAAATVRAFAERARAERVVLLVDRGEGDAVMLDCGADGTVTLTEGDDTRPVTADGEPRALPELRPPPPSALRMDPETGELEAPLGAVANLALGVLALARAFGGRSVATADFPTRDPRLPLTIAARDGEPLVLAAGDRRFLLAEEDL